MKSLFKLSISLILFCSLIACDKQEVLENRLEKTDWKLTKKITTNYFYSASNFTSSETDVFKDFLISFDENGEGTIMNPDNSLDEFEWKTYEAEGEFRVDILVDTLFGANYSTVIANYLLDINRTFSIVLNDRDIQIWETSASLQFTPSSGTGYKEKWEMRQE